MSYTPIQIISEINLQIFALHYMYLSFTYLIMLNSIKQQMSLYLANYQIIIYITIRLHCIRDNVRFFFINSFHVGFYVTPYVAICNALEKIIIINDKNSTFS